MLGCSQLGYFLLSILIVWQAAPIASPDYAAAVLMFRPDTTCLSICMWLSVITSSFGHIVYNRAAYGLQAQIDSNLAKSAELLDVINKNTQAYRQAFGFREWRQACEVRHHVVLSHYCLHAA